MRRLILAVALTACASQGDPPGGPEDKVPPELLATSPESSATSVRLKHVEFRFDEVVNERPQGNAATIAQLFLISPNDGAPRVDWNRSSITVRPRRNWRPNTVYTVTLLPGLADLRGNVRTEGASIIFSTGASIPATRIAGAIFDWVAGRPAARGAIEALFLPESTAYVAQADSLGRFVLSHVPPGEYVVRGYLDANRNRELDPREAWDSTALTLRDSARVELLAFVHDTLGPRIDAVTVADSFTLRVSFDKPLDPAQRVEPALFALTAADSAVVPIRSAVTAREWDRLRADSIALADTTRGGGADTTGADTTAATRALTPAPSRPPPVTDLVVITRSPLRPETTYRLEARAVRGLLGNPATSGRVFDTPKRQTPTGRAPPPAPTDTARARPPR